MKTSRLIIVLSLGLIFMAARPPHEKKGAQKRDGQHASPIANCTPPTASAELDINNVRALIQSGGDMWWDFNRSRYEIPKGSNKVSLFAGSLWIAGQDVSGQSKVAAMRFRGRGNDYWAGPISTDNAEIDPQTCKDYDRHWITTRSMISQFVAWNEAKEAGTAEELFPGYSVPQVIREWPAEGRYQLPYSEARYLAPFVDVNDDKSYDWRDGDYPGYRLRGDYNCDTRKTNDLYGDQSIWWVFNDKGNVHTETGGTSIGMEIRAQAFSFTSTDEVNNMTFYNYEIINRSSFELRETYFGQWVDGDLGNHNDDYVGCDVQRGLGFFYNADDYDEDANGNLGYGANPPAIGVDFFQGPFQENDGKDNCVCVNDYAAAIDDGGIVYDGQGAGYGDGKIDNERYGMRKFLYHSASGPDATTDPEIASDYYNFLRGIWKDGTNMTYGGNGYDPSNPAAIPTGYMFPGTSDPSHWGTAGVDPGRSDWTEHGEGNLAGDRRFAQSSGPFTLAPGAVNNVTVGVVWAQATNGGARASLELMRKADDKTQALFDNCFQISEAPHAPNVAAQELDQRAILMLSNPGYSNNYAEKYAQIDAFLASPDSVDSDGDGIIDLPLTQEEKRAYSTFTFEGYQVFQLADGSVGINDLENPDKARIVAQVDRRNDIDRLINYEFDPLLELDVPVLKVEGANEGIRHSFEVTEDLFAQGDARLINHKTYYFMVVAYAHNNYGGDLGNLSFIASDYDPTDPDKFLGQKLPYIRSRIGASGPIRVIKVIPHRTEIEQNGITLQSSYGDGVELVRIEGLGNGGRFLKHDASNAPQVDKGAPDRLDFGQGHGPVDVKVVDPLGVKPGKFTLAFVNPEGEEDWANLEWMLYGAGVDTIFSEQTIQAGDELIIPELGISVKSTFGFAQRQEKAERNGFVGFEVSYDDETDQWLGGLADQDNDQLRDWIKSGDAVRPWAALRDEARDDHKDNFGAFTLADFEDANSLDEEQDWENMAGRTWAPFFLCGYDTAHPVPLHGYQGITRYKLAEDIIEAASSVAPPSVDIRFTPDQSLWTRCPVIEMTESPTVSEGGVGRGELRRALSVDKNGLNQLDAGVNLSEATLGGTQVLGDDVAQLSERDKAFYATLGFDNDQKLRNLSFGMGWFPGYAVDMETGERLNMAFGEASWLAKENGADMKWNPTANTAEILFGEARFGGKHVVYVFRNNREDASLGVERMMPGYDEGEYAFRHLLGWDPSEISHVTGLSTGEGPHKDYLSVWGSGAWAGYPILTENGELFGASGENELVISLRSAVPFQPWASQVLPANTSLVPGEVYFVKEGAIEVVAEGETNASMFRKGQRFVPAVATYTALTSTVELCATVNGGRPLYEFSTDDLAPTKSPIVGHEALSDIKAVPNPYYAYSEYETGRLDNRIKIINLPQTCEVNIFTVGGQLVRTFKKDDPTITSIDWDLKNSDDIPIASGLYIIHVNAPGIGEQLIKWFGTVRPVDLNAF